MLGTAARSPPKLAAMRTRRSTQRAARRAIALCVGVAASCARCGAAVDARRAPSNECGPAGRGRRLDRPRPCPVPARASARPSTADPATRAAATSAPRASACWRTPTPTRSSAGTRFQTATAMGGLPYMTPLRITWGGRSAIAYKRDFGFGGAPIAGLPRVIDLWWELAAARDPVRAWAVVGSGHGSSERRATGSGQCSGRR